MCGDGRHLGRGAVPQGRVELGQYSDSWRRVLADNLYSDKPISWYSLLWQTLISDINKTCQNVAEPPVHLKQ